MQTRYFPVSCPDGDPPFLTPLVTGEGGALAPRCPRCGGTGQLIPGAYYTDATRERFERVVEVIENAKLAPEQAQAATNLIDALNRNPNANTLRATLFKVSGMQPLQFLLPANEQELRGFLGLLLVVLTAFAKSGRGPSSEASPTRLITGVHSVRPDPSDDSASGTAR